MSDENYGYPSEGLEALCLCEKDADTLELALVDVIEVGGNPAAGLATVAETGDYADLLNKPVIPTTAAQVGAVAAEPGKRLLTAEEAETLQIIDPEATKNRPDAELLARSNHTGSQAISTVVGLTEALDGKVTKETGKGLSTNDFSTLDKIKLDRVADDATKNSPDVVLLNRENHTGTQSMATIDGLAAALDEKLSPVPGKVLSSNDYTDADKAVVTNLGGDIAALEEGKVDKVAGKGLSSADFTAAEKAKLATLSAFDPTPLQQQVTALATGKVDKVAGKGLSTEDFTSAEKTKLSGLSNFDATVINAAITDLQTNKVNKSGNKVLSTEDYTTADKNKLAGIGAGATANAADQTLLARANHTGVQAIATVTGLQDALNARVLAVEGSTLLTTAQAAKLASVASGATVNRPDAELLARANHTGTQAQSTVAGLELALSTNATATAKNATDIASLDVRKVDAVANKVLSSNDYTNAEKTKLAGLTNYNDAALVASVANKVDKVAGKGLSSTDFTQEEKDKLAGLANYDPTELITAVSNIINATSQYNEDTFVKKEAGKGLSTADFLPAEKSKLEAIPFNASANAPDSFLINRENHQGAQPMSSVTGLTAALAQKVDAVQGKILTTNDYTTVDKNKLAGIAPGATVNSTDTSLLARSNHTGTQGINTVSGLQDILTAYADSINAANLQNLNEFSFDITPWADSRGAQNWSTSTTPPAPLSRSPLWRMEARGQMVRMRYDQMQSVSGDSIAQLKNRMLTNAAPSGIAVTPNQVPPGIAWLQIGTNSVNAGVALGKRGVPGTLMGDLWWCIDWLVARGHRVMLLAEWPRGDTSADSGLLTPDNQKLMYAYHNAILQIKTKNVWIVDVWPRAADPARMDAAPRPGMLNNDNLHESIGIAEVTCDEGVRVMRDEMGLKRIKATASSNGDQWDAALNPGGCLNVNPMFVQGTGGTVTPGTAFDGSVACTGVAPQNYTLSSSGGLKAFGRFGKVTLDDGTIHDAYLVDISGRATTNNAYISLRQPGLLPKIASGDLLEGLYECVVQNPNENFSCPGLMIDSGAAATRAYGGLSITNDKQMPTSLLRPSTYWVPRAAQMPIGATLPSQITLDFRAYFVLGGAYSATAGSDLSVASSATIAFISGSLRKVQPQ